ncbi:pseudouridine synthase [Polychytrium aggregatum]|uniref:pseudouridine synthase n=1 Tax=Polychytrium aggregatum TaxID=110093 RepID=UPI0022FDD797|nr:pseudouridine synthase [Polychytrium aggregatum]KAI9209567.1 pseudouridine synthase [Polychytrium aggregatum]
MANRRSVPIVVSKRALVESQEAANKRLRLANSPSAYLVEDQVGITQFLDPDRPSWSGIIKQWTKDFYVFEVDKSGEIVRYTGQSALVTGTDGEQVAVAEDPLQHLSPKEKGFVLLEELLADDKVAFRDLQGLVAQGGPNEDGIEMVITKPILEKEHRANIHRTTLEYFGELIHTETTGDAKNQIMFRYATDEDKTNRLNMNSKRPKRKANRRLNNSIDWDSIGHYCQFTLLKENKDTMDALSLISKLAEVESKAFSFAGTKDRRAVTTQKVTAFHVSHKVLQNLELRHGTAVGDFKYVNKKLELGDLQGNHFVITLRNVLAKSMDDVERSFAALRDDGFINYYGMQRFGTRSVSTHHVGIQMMQGNWEEAVNMVLGVKNEERQDIQQAREIWLTTKDAFKALAAFPPFCTAERAILKYFVSNARKKERLNDHCGAMKAIPVNMRQMYVHAYQSFVWNQAVSERVRQFGNRVVVGDLVLPENLQLNDSNDFSEGSVRATSSKQPVVVVDSEEEAEKYTCWDIVLPMPGFDVTYPTNSIGQFYVDVMKKDGLDPKDMKKKDWKVFVKPKDVSWRALRYNDLQSQLCLSDLDRVNNVPEPQNVEGGRYLGIVCEFTLPSSSYATVALREIMKIGTSTGHHTALARELESAHVKSEPAEERAPE